LARLKTWGDQLVAEGTLPCAITLVARKGQVAGYYESGSSDIKTKSSYKYDTIWRMYSMTKPVTGVAAMILIEEGKMSLSDPLSKYIPAFAETKVFKQGTVDNYETVPLETPITIHHLLTHTSGYIYEGLGEGGQHPCEQLMTKNKLGLTDSKKMREKTANLEIWTNELAKIPLYFQPGTGFGYGYGLDILGRVIEVVSGVRFDEFFKKRIFEPLKMIDTGFTVPKEKLHRVPSCYNYDGKTLIDVTEEETIHDPETDKQRFLGGGHGLVSTISDYYRFAQMLLNRGELDGVRILGSRTVDYMTKNHFPGNQCVEHLAVGSNKSFILFYAPPGTASGLGVFVCDNPIASQALIGKGSYSWGGRFGTFFWVDPKEEMICLFMTQAFGATSWKPLYNLVYSSLTE